MTETAPLPDLDRLPTFEEPWQAQAFGCAMALSRSGLFSWSEWAAAFGDEIRVAPERPGEGANAAYFRQWLAALERLVIEKRGCGPAELAAREDAWRRAYLNTPHGHPVELENANRPPDHDHDDDDDHHRASAPVAVSPARSQ